MINIDSAGTDNRLALITELKADVDLQTIPIIALIEPEQEQLADAARLAGCDDVVMKPLDIRQLQVLLMQATIDWPPIL
jgi:CheY-like chemotaxis protein